MILPWRIVIYEKTGYFDVVPLSGIIGKLEKPTRCRHCVREEPRKFATEVCQLWEGARNRGTGARKPATSVMPSISEREGGVDLCISCL